MSPLLSHVLRFEMRVEMETFVEFQATNIAEILLGLLRFFPNVDSNMLLQIELEERAVRTKVAKHVLDVHVQSHYVSPPVPNHCTAIIALSDGFCLRVFSVDFTLVDTFQVNH